jgi:hypothetical protein
MFSDIVQLLFLVLDSLLLRICVGLSNVFDVFSVNMLVIGMMLIIFFFLQKNEKQTFVFFTFVVQPIEGATRFGVIS